MGLGKGRKLCLIIVFVLKFCVFSWGSGANPWGPEKEDQFAKPTHYDGMLEVVGVTGVVHMGQIHSGLRSAMRIAQGGHVSTSLSNTTTTHKYTLRKKPSE